MPLQIIIGDAEPSPDQLAKERPDPITCNSCGHFTSVPSIYHLFNCLSEQSDIPLPDGSDLENLDQVARWLLYPKNLVDTVLFIVKWQGNVPYLSKHHAKEADKCLLEVVLREHIRRKRGLSVRDQLLEEAES